ncbi:hypothetical protein [Sphingobium sp.]|uniref:hypothetical protein n=1 Tax=Sphingobium sp. TaxID=1912891 RepID=UPI003BB64457
MTPDFALIAAYADAQSGLVQLSERARLSPIRQPWLKRMAIVERQALARLDGTSIDDADIRIDGRGTIIPSPFDLTRWSHALSERITLDALLNDSAALLAWLGIDLDMPDEGVLTRPHRPRPDIIAAIGAWRQAVTAAPPAPPLLHSALLTHSWLQIAPIGEGDRVAAMLIGGRWGPGRWHVPTGGLVALGFEHRKAAWKGAGQEAFSRLWLDAIIAGARSHLDLEMRLRAYAGRAAHRIAERRRPGRLKDVIMLAMIHPRLTSNRVAKMLSLTSAGAIKLLTIAVEEGLLIEQSGQASYRSYAIPVAMTRAGHDIGMAGTDDPNFWCDDAQISGPKLAS